jgi:predicted nucleic acid-binding protein
MTERVFVDTNVLVYARDASEGAKHRRAREWMAHLWESETGRTSVQVLNEFYVTVTLKLRPGLGRDEARGEIRQFQAWRPVALDASLGEKAWEIQDRHRLSYWDSLIVAAAQVSGCDRLLTEDFGAGQDLDGLRVVNPFTLEPG